MAVRAAWVLIAIAATAGSVAQASTVGVRPERVGEPEGGYARALIDDYVNGIRGYFDADNDEDRLAALEYFERAAEAGHIPSIRMLGRAFHYDLELPSDIAEAEKWYLKGVALGDPASYTALGDIYANVHGNSAAFVNLKRARIHYEEAQQRGCAIAPIGLGNLYAKGVGVAKDPAKALEHYAIAIERGNTGVGHMLSFVLYDWGALPDPTMAKAIDHLNKAAEAGEGRAAVYVGDSFRRGYWEKFGTEQKHAFPKDEKLAEAWYRHGHARGQSQASLALAGLILERNGGAIDDLEVEELLQVAEASPALSQRHREEITRVRADSSLRLERARRLHPHHGIEEQDATRPARFEAINR